ncbi:ABC transporter permease [Nocardioides sp. cx-169]|uniref:ABC transporter permease n=1 Tax=Nocardioides sp. cx-169 TaxID=2899080 RepID=UPI001E652A4E|nr:ABC transporter permease [Nocardioides sp. cx-169]MCD4532902.1 ABC transporter permease [Nocardioides sp. cx-169]
MTDHALGVHTPVPAPALGRPALASRYAGSALLWARKAVVGAVYIVVALALWHLVVVALSIDPLVVPKPLPVLEALWSQLQSAVVYGAMWVTFQEAMIGFAAGAGLGMLMAVLLAESDLAYKILNPSIVAFQALPKVALTPLFIVWFGFGIWSKAILVASFVFFPVLVNMYTGLRSSSAEEDELMRVSHASRWQRFRHLRWYKSLPFLFAAFETSFVMCLTGAVFAELMGSGKTVGLGTLVQLYTSRMDMPGLFAIIALLSLFGVLLDVFVKLGKRFFLAWDRAPAR